MNTFVKSMMMTMVLMSLSMTINAQRYQSRYEVRNNTVRYEDRVIANADAASFQILGNGYAKDRNNVYLDGQVLRYVDPYTFRLIGGGNGNATAGEVVGGRGHDTEGYYDNRNHNNDHNGRRPFNPRYVISSFDVYFDGRKVDGAFASSFKDMGNGYGKDSFSVYYYGEKLPGSNSNTFKILEDGYAKDSFTVYFYGEKTKGSASTFKVLGDGYAKDAFDVFYYGEKVNGAIPNSFKVDRDGYAHDAFHTYYYGRKL